jgi:hypothetical protein
VRSATALVTAALLLVGCTSGSLSTPRQTRRPSPSIPASVTRRAPHVSASIPFVPWVDRPAGAAVVSHVPSWHRRGVPNDAPACRRDALRVRRVASSGGMGTDYLSITWVNRTRHACRVIGTARIAAITPHGTVPLGPSRFYVFARRLNGPPADVRPGRSVVTTFGGSPNCDAGLRPHSYAGYRDFRVELPSGASYEIHRPLITVCGVTGSAFGVPSAARRIHRLRLRVQLHVPTVRHIGPLRYEVTLRNPHDRPYPLRPCPTYQQFLFGSAGTVHHRYRLNCARVHAVAPHRSVTYAMHIQVRPARTADGVEHLVWELDADFPTWSGSPVHVP